MIVDAGATAWAAEAFLGEKLARADVIGTALATEVFGILDALMQADGRLSAFLADGGSPKA